MNKDKKSSFYIAVALVLMVEFLIYYRFCDFLLTHLFSLSFHAEGIAFFIIIFIYIVIIMPCTLVFINHQFHRYK